MTALERHAAMASAVRVIRNGITVWFGATEKNALTATAQAEAGVWSAAGGWCTRAEAQLKEAAP